MRGNPGLDLAYTCERAVPSPLQFRRDQPVLRIDGVVLPDADFRALEGNWHHHKFRGTVWQNVNNSSHKVFLTNAYRVLLTRARQGMVIYVPRGDAADPTRLPAFYEGTL
jgi:schlafen family protein